MDPSPPGPAREDPEPWGRFRPSPGQRLVIAATRALAFPLLKQLALALRRGVRARLGPEVDVRLWGFRVRLASRGNVTGGRLIFVPRSWDPAERRAIAGLLRPGATFVDVGANAGGYVWWVLSRMGEGCRILALEPDPELADRLRFNLAANGIRNVRVLEAAVGTEPGRGSLRIDRRNRGENALVEGAGSPDGGPGVPVAVLSLEGAVRAAGLDRVDLLKIDIEGSEPRVLDAFFREADPALWPRALITERKDTAEHAGLEARLGELGYRVVRRTRLNLVCVREAGAAR